MIFRIGTIASLMLVLAAGCGGSGGPTLYDVKGTVTFDGQPVPSGRIEFEPDKESGNEGGPGFADIVDGKYDTAAAGGRGTLGGPHVVRLRGQSSPPPSAGPDGTIDENAPVVEAKILFSNYTESHDLPKSATTLDLNVPASAKFDPAATSGTPARSAVPDP